MWISAGLDETRDMIWEGTPDCHFAALAFQEKAANRRHGSVADDGNCPWHDLCDRRQNLKNSLVKASNTKSDTPSLFKQMAFVQPTDLGRMVWIANEAAILNRFKIGVVWHQGLADAN